MKLKRNIMSRNIPNLGEWVWEDVGVGGGVVEFVKDAKATLIRSIFFSRPYEKIWVYYSRRCYV